MLRAILLVAGCALAHAGAIAQLSDDVATRVERLGPAPFLAGFDSLEALTTTADAVVVATLSSPGRLVFREFAAADGVRTSIIASGVYPVVIRDVLAAKAAAGPLRPGVVIEALLRVGREAARDIHAGRDLVTVGDECLLFLFADPSGWNLIGWHLQFRRNRMEPAMAELISRTSRLPSAGWFGPDVVGREGDQTRLVTWSSLVDAIKAR